jgi:hypothetical protein
MDGASRPRAFQARHQHRSPDGRLHANRWIYHPDGCVNALAIMRKIWVAPLYRMPDPQAFEKLLRSDTPLDAPE